MHTNSRADVWRAALNDGAGGFESPIEKMFAAELFSQLACEPVPIGIQPQAPVGPYFADFLLTLGERRVAVECDGKEFHSAPDQIAYDQRRDQFFERRGIVTLRFSGARIHADAAACVREALAAVSPAVEAASYAPPMSLEEIRAAREQAAIEAKESERRQAEADERRHERDRATLKEKLARMRGVRR